MKIFKMLGAAIALLLSYGFTPVHAQDAEDESAVAGMSEIVVTARKREENLMDIPVSASVISDSLIADAGITNLYDLFEMIPGIHYDEEQDRLAALPSIRGVQANDVASNRTKVTAFIDGMPVLGSQGSIGFNGFQQVEVYRGPQSAAFGRSTFAGAINYVTKDPGDEFASEVGVDFNDYGTRIINGSLDIPVSDTVGFRLDASYEDSTSPDEYHATGNAGYKNLGGVDQNALQSDGTEYGARSGLNATAKLVFEPSDDLKMSMTFGHTEIDDQQAPTLFLTESARDACFDGNGFYAGVGMMAPFLSGTLNCDWDDARANYVQHDAEAFLLANPDYLAYLVARAESGVDAQDMGMGPLVPATPQTINGTLLSVEEQILLMARSYSIPKDDRGTSSDRDRLTFQLDKSFANDSSVQFSFMHSEEDFLRAQGNGFFYYDPDNIGVFDDGIIDTYDMAPGPLILFNNDMGMGPSDWDVLDGMGPPRYPTPSTGEISENYAEFRWVSPGADRLRYVVGASYYEYEFSEERWGGPGMGVEAVAYAASLNGIVDEFMELSGFAAAGVPYVADREIIGEDAENMAVFFNVGYDLTDRLTLSIEGRYQSDKIGASNQTTGLSEEVTTDTFVPRVSMTFNATDTSSFYLQWAKGVNPAGINVGVLSANTLGIFNDGIEFGLIPFSAALNADVVNNTTGAAVPDGIIDAYDNTNQVWYTDASWTTRLTGVDYQTGFAASEFTSYDEEEINQLEFGFKGRLFDGRMTYAGAVFLIDWVDQLQNGSLELGSPCENPVNVGDPAGGTCTLDGQQYFWVADADGSNLAAGLNSGDVQTYGLELEADFRISDKWSVRAQASLLQAEYDEFCDIAALNTQNFTNDPELLDALDLTVQVPTPGETLTSPCYITSGNDVAGQPNVSGSISPSYTTGLYGMRFNTRLDVRYEGSQYDNSGNYTEYPSATTVNLSSGLSGEKWTATVYVNNLFDEDSPRQYFGFPDDTSQQGTFASPNPAIANDFLGRPVTTPDYYIRETFSYQPRAPRTIGFRGVYRF